MTPLNRLSSWRQRISRLCGLSHSTTQSAHNHRDQFENEEMDQSVEMEQSDALHDFINRVHAMEKNKFITANLEFAKLRTAQENFQTEEEFSMSDGFAAIQNRYRDVVPYNKNRIRLKDNETSGDYINASMIEYPNISRRYIAAQAPLSSNIDDFWHMIGQYKIRVVVMLCKVVENSLVKCVQYWPFNVGEKMELENGSVETIKVDHFDDFSIREIRFKSQKFGDSTIYQLHYTEWPDHGCPDSELHIPKFIESMDQYQIEHGGDAPILIHCSAGCGRTGTVIGVDMIRILIEENKINHRIDLKSFVLELRKQRTSCVQSPSQYALLYTLVAHYCKLALGKTKTSEKTTEDDHVQLVGSNQEATTTKIPQSNGNLSEDSQIGSMAADGSKDELIVDV